MLVGFDDISDDSQCIKLVRTPQIFALPRVGGGGGGGLTLKSVSVLLSKQVCETSVNISKKLKCVAHGNIVAFRGNLSAGSTTVHTCPIHTSTYIGDTECYQHSTSTTRCIFKPSYF
jgi:hypothetical protein